MNNPINQAIGAIFVPVSNLEHSRDWYCELLGVPADGEIISGHLYVIPLQNEVSIVLDSKIFSQHVVSNAPLFHFNTNDPQAAYQYVNERNIAIESDIQFDQFFNVKDPDGNVIMICKC
ncbi:VOC family protein [Rossellomorea aquimaris]|uniref:VOC family protein n=1 Tax=Rossellomorea aquimaris TaxID=189382 RepID=UPI0007D05637|nr:VOC family protein [Rossellomorea aquimaris]